MLGFVVPGLSVACWDLWSPLAPPGMLGSVVSTTSHRATCCHLKALLYPAAGEPLQIWSKLSSGTNSRQPRRMKILSYGTSPWGPFPLTLFVPLRSRWVFLLVDKDANRRGGLSIGFRAGAQRLEGRRRDKERELRGGRGWFGSGRCRCSPEVFRPGCGSVLSSWAPSARLRQASVREPQAAAAASCQPRTSVPGRSWGASNCIRPGAGRGREGSGGGRSLRRRTGGGGRARWASGERVAGKEDRNGVRGPPAGPGAGGGERGVRRKGGDVDGSPVGRGRGAAEWDWERLQASETGVWEARLGPRREAGKGLRPVGEGRGTSVGWPRSPAASGGKPTGQQGESDLERVTLCGTNTDAGVELSQCEWGSRIPLRTPQPHPTLYSPSCFHNFSSSLVAPSRAGAEEG